MNQPRPTLKPFRRTCVLFGAFVALVAGSPSRALAREPEQPVAAVVVPERAAIESVLDSMKRAVLAGDGAAYLAHVVPAAGAAADPVFRKEQENWAKDLKDHVPDEFDLSISDPKPDDDEIRRASFMPARAEFELQMRWKMKPVEGRAAARRAREVSIPVVFVRPDAAADGGWLFAGENWVTIDGPPGAAVRAKCMAGFEKAARDAVAVFPEVRERVEEGFEEKIPHVQEIKIYTSMRHLQASIYLSYVDALGGWNEPGESIKLLAMAASSKGAVRTLLGHEFGHVATFEFGPHATDMPWWILEGVAEISGGAFSKSQWAMTERVVRAWARADDLADWDEITDFRKTPSAKHTYVYRQGEHMVGYISTRFGRTARNAWLRAMAQGKTLDEATVEALKLPFAELDTQWRASLTEPAPPAAKPKPNDHDE